MGLRRLSSGEAKKILALLDEADRDLIAQLQLRLRLDPRSYTIARMNKILLDVRGLRRATIARLRGEMLDDLLKIGGAETAFETRMLTEAIPFRVDFGAVPTATVRAIATKGVYSGRTVNEWFRSLHLDDDKRIAQQLRLGMIQQETIPDIIRRVRGTRANGFAGPLRTTRHQAEAVVRTVVNGVSNAARESVWAENPDVVKVVQWVATLDGRTTLICAGRDGKVAAVPLGSPLPPDAGTPLTPPGARPPAHPSCRSIMIAQIAPDIISQRPFVVDKRHPDRRVADFRADARRTGRPIAEIRREWSDKHIGTLPGKTDFDTFLRRQTPAFQDRYLGPTRGAAFRQGTRIDQFTTRNGTELTVEQFLQTV